MLSIETIPPSIFSLMTGLSSGDTIGSEIGADANSNAVGKDIQQMNVHFDRSANWDEEREVLTDRQRIRDLETYVFGDRRGLTIGVLRQMRSHVIWLIVLSLLQFLTVLLLAVLIWSSV